MPCDDGLVSDLGACAARHLPWARFDDAVTGTAHVFQSPYAALAAQSSEQVAAVLDDVDRATQEGAWAFGYVAYEAAAGLGAGPAVDDREPGVQPLAWFGLCEEPTAVPLVSAPPGDTRGYSAMAWQPGWTDTRYRDDVASVREHIPRGDIYQCNLTVRLHSRIQGDLTQLYADLVLN